MLLDTGLEAAAFAWDALGALGASADAFAVEKRELKGSTFLGSAIAGVILPWSVVELL